MWERGIEGELKIKRIFFLGIQWKLALLKL
jgi:hypothetical protein